jgi:hypothetical protein
MPEHVPNQHDERIAATFIKAHPTLLSKGNYTVDAC